MKLKVAIALVTLNFCYGCVDAQKLDEHQQSSDQTTIKSEGYARIKGAEALKETRQYRNTSSTKSSSPVWLTRVGNKIYFLTDFERGLGKLWVTDGTAEGTLMLQDIPDLRYEQMIEYKEELIFTANQGGKWQIWKIPKGKTEPIPLGKSYWAKYHPSHLYPWGDKLYVQGHQQGDQLWLTYDSEHDQLREVHRFSSQNINMVVEQLNGQGANFFINVVDYSRPVDKRNTLWCFNAERETMRIMDTIGVSRNEYIGEILVAGDQLFCLVDQLGENDKTWPVLHVVNGKKGTIEPLKDPKGNLLVGVKGLSVVGDYVVFNSATSEDVMESAEIVTSTFSYSLVSNKLQVLQRTLEADKPRFTPDFNHKGLLYFSYGRNTGVHNFDRQIWVTDGTPEGTKFVYDIWAMTGYYNQYNFAQDADDIYFPGGETEFGFELWKINSADKTIQMVTNLEHSDGMNYVSCLTALNGKLIFTHANQTYGEELWVKDTKGTRLLIDINKDRRF